MSRILEYKSSGEEEIVSRILIQIHRSVDEHFPDAMAASRQFSKTVFSENENTAIVRAPGVDAGEERETTKEINIGETTETEPKTEIHKTAEKEQAPKHKTPPPPKPRTKAKAPSKSDMKTSSRRQEKPNDVSDLRSRVATQLPEEELATGIQDNTTYGEIMFWGAMLIAGLILLAYVLFAVMM